MSVNVVRLRVTVPSEVGTALRALAQHRGTTVSTIVTCAVEHEIRMAELRADVVAQPDVCLEGRTRDEDRSTEVALFVKAPSLPPTTLLAGSWNH